MSDQSDDPAGRSRHGTVVVADDNAVYHLVLRRQLTMLGYDVVVTESVDTLLSAVDEHRPDLVLMDQHLPGPDPAAVVSALHDRCSAPVVCMSTSVVPGRRERCEHSGVEAVVGKPIPVQELGSLLLDAAPPRGGDEPVEPVPVNEATLRDLAEQMRSATIVADVLTTFIDGVSGRVRALEAATLEEDTPAVRRVAHSLKSAATLVGLDTVARTAGELELSPADGALVQRLLRVLPATVQPLSTARERLLHGPG